MSNTSNRHLTMTSSIPTEQLPPGYSSGVLVGALGGELPRATTRQADSAEQADSTSFRAPIEVADWISTPKPSALDFESNIIDMAGNDETAEHPTLEFAPRLDANEVATEVKALKPARGNLSGVLGLPVDEKRLTAKVEKIKSAASSAGKLAMKATRLIISSSDAARWSRPQPENQNAANTEPIKPSSNSRQSRIYTPKQLRAQARVEKSEKARSTYDAEQAQIREQRMQAKNTRMKKLESRRAQVKEEHPTTAKILGLPEKDSTKLLSSKSVARLAAGMAVVASGLILPQVNVNHESSKDSTNMEVLDRGDLDDVVSQARVGSVKTVEMEASTLEADETTGIVNITDGKSEQAGHEPTALVINNGDGVSHALKRYLDSANMPTSSELSDELADVMTQLFGDRLFRGGNVAVRQDSAKEYKIYGTGQAVLSSEQRAAVEFAYRQLMTRKNTVSDDVDLILTNS